MNDKELIEKRDLIRRAMKYRSGPDSARTVYLGSMATANLHHILGLAYGKGDFAKALEAANDATLDKLIEACGSVIKHMKECPTAECSCCGTTVPTNQLSTSVGVTVKSLEWERTVDGHRGSERREQWAARTPWGYYYIWHYQMPDDEKERGPKYTIGSAMTPYLPTGVEYGSLDEAQTAAFADYKRRIRSVALSHPSKPEVEGSNPRRINATFENASEAELLGERKLSSTAGSG